MLKKCSVGKQSKGDNFGEYVSMLHLSSTWHVQISREAKMATDSLCLENIDEFVHDENKIVSMAEFLVI